MSKKANIGDIKSLHLCPDLSPQSLGKSITRHYVNLHLILDHSELVLLNWLVFMSDSVCYFEYSKKLFQQFSVSADRANEIYFSGPIGYNTSYNSLRKSFGKLVDKGIIVPVNKGYMICPALVHNRNSDLYSPTKILNRYKEVYESEDPINNLKLFCQEIIETNKNEIKRANKYVKAKNNIIKRGQKS